MKRVGLWAAMLMLVTGTTGAQETAAAKTVKPISAIAWVVGGVWTADTSKLGGGMQRIETWDQWSDNGSYIGFTTPFVSDQGALKNYDGKLLLETGG